MTWATVISLGFISVFSMARAFYEPKKSLSEDAKRAISFFRSLWLFALAYAIWDRYL